MILDFYEMNQYFLIHRIYYKNFSFGYIYPKKTPLTDWEESARGETSLGG